MRYEKPIVMDLSARARSAGGCLDGNSALGLWESCSTGNGAQRSCGVGAGGGDRDLCVPGIGVSSGDCLSGNYTNGYTCTTGTLPNTHSDPYGCRAGPNP